MVVDQRAGSPATGDEGGGRRTASPPPQAVMGLLNYITATSLDEDYAHVSRQRRAADDERPAKRRRGKAGLVVLAAFGVLVATAGVQTARDADVSATSRESLVRQVNARSAQLTRQRTTVQDLQRELSGLRSGQLNATTEGRSLSARLDRLRVLTRGAAGRGPRGGGRRRRRARGEVAEVPGAGPGPAEARQRAVGGRGRGRRRQRAAADQPQRDPRRRLGDHRQLRVAAAAVHRVRDREPQAAGRAAARHVRRTDLGDLTILWPEVRRHHRGPDVAAPRETHHPALRAPAGAAPVIAALGLLAGVLLGLFLQPDVPVWLQPYLPIAVVAALDAVFGALRAFLDGIFDDKVFVVSFVSNVLIAALIVYLGDKLGVGGQLSTGVIVVLGIRIFSNVAAIRRHIFHA